MKSTLQSYLLVLFTFLAIFAAKASDDIPPRGTLKGRVYTSDHKPADNVTLILQGTRHATATDESGRFELTAPAGSYTLIISHVGASTITLPVEIRAGQTVTLNEITLNVSENALQEVQINGDRTNRFAIKKSVDVAKMPLTNLENSQVYTNISSGLISEQNLYTVDEALRNAPGIQKMWDATGRGGDGGAYFSLRGFVTQSKLRNGVAGLVTSSIDATNIDHLEIIKGPSATLFGSALTSYGGLVNRVTKKPYDTFGGEVGYTGGSYGLSREYADINTPLDPKKKVLFRLNTAYTNQNSFQDAGFNKNVAFDPSLVYKATDKLSFQVDAELMYGLSALNTIYFFPYATGTQTVAQYLGAGRADQLGIDYKKSYYSRDMSERSRSSNYYAQMNYKFSDHLTSHTIYSYGRSYSNGFGPYFYLAPHDSIQRLDQSTRNSKQSITEVQENLNADFKIGSVRNRTLLGLDYLHVNSDQLYLEGSWDVAPLNSSTFNYGSFNKVNMNNSQYNVPGNYGTFPYIYKNSTYSAYLGDVVNITDQLIASATIRVDRFDNKGSYDPATSTTSGAYKQTAWSPKFGLIYQVVKDRVSLFANYQNGFTNQTGTDFNHNTFKPEHANQIEGGVKLDAFEGRLSGSVSYYDIKVADILRTDLAHPQFSVQDGTQASRGVEADITTNPVQGLNIIAGFAYNNSKYQNIDANLLGLRPATAGSPVLANLWISYRFQDNALKGFGLAAGGNYASDNKVVNSVSQGVFILPSYTVLNASAFYDTKAYRVGLSVNNFTDKKYYTGYSSINPQMLRQYVLSIAFKF